MFFKREGHIVLSDLCLEQVAEVVIQTGDKMKVFSGRQRTDRNRKKRQDCIRFVHGRQACTQ